MLKLLKVLMLCVLLSATTNIFAATTGFVGDMTQEKDGTIWVQLVDSSGVELGTSRVTLPDADSRKSMLAMLLTAKSTEAEVTMVWEAGNGWVELTF